MDDPSVTEAQGKSRLRTLSPAVADGDSGHVTLAASALDHLPRAFDSATTNGGEMNVKIARALGLSDDGYLAVSKTMHEVLKQAREEQIAPLGPLEFEVDKTVEIPGLDRERIGALIEAFTAALPAELDTASRTLLGRMFRRQMEKEYGADLWITLRTDGPISIPPSDTGGVKFFIESEAGGKRTGSFHPSAYPAGSRFDFLKLPERLMPPPSPFPYPYSQ